MLMLAQHGWGVRGMNGGGEVEGLEDGGEQLAQLSPRKYLEKPVHELQVGRCACVGSGTSETDCFLPLFFFFIPKADGANNPGQDGSRFSSLASKDLG